MRKALLPSMLLVLLLMLTMLAFAAEVSIEGDWEGYWTRGVENGTVKFSFDKPQGNQLTGRYDTMSNAFGSIGSIAVEGTIDGEKIMLTILSGPSAGVRMNAVMTDENTITGVSVGVRRVTKFTVTRVSPKK